MKKVTIVKSKAYKTLKCGHNDSVVTINHYFDDQNHDILLSASYDG